jgi:peptidoglycan hydrolase-like protein with peptidoglycan-binding domain
MLTSHRFTAIPTRDCRNRLESALSNSQPIARGERHKAAVAAIQSALADLNRGYLLPVEVDGYFGSRTYAAVEAFQRDYGLAADGTLGRQTMMQLDTLYDDDVVRHPVGRSISIGVNSLNTAHYGADFALASCVNDARKMQEIAQALGYDATTFENKQATVANFTAFMRGAINDLVAGDSLLITFSGHGSQLPNTSDDNEADLLDETLCFYDRMLIDDEFHALLAQLRDGVRVHAVFDSCHSKTAYKDILIEQPKTFEDVQKKYYDKDLAKLKELTTVTVVTIANAAPGEEDNEDTVSGQPIATDSLSKALDGDKPELANPPKFKEDRNDEIASLFADLEADALTGKAKTLKQADSFPIYNRNKDLYDAIKDIVGPQEDQHLSCSLVTLSACQDSQTTAAGEVYSLFTYNIISAWGGAEGFDGSYTQFFNRLKNVSPPDSTPGMDTEGPGQGTARLYDRPFVF